MNTEGARRAALAMCAMHPADRRWMLARVPKTWRAMLASLIREAKKFNSFDVSLLQEVLDGPDLDEVTATVDVPPPAVLIAVLDGLPCQWAARVLVAAASDHTEIYLVACNKLRGDAIRAEISQVAGPLPRALAAAMANCLHEAAHTLKPQEAAR